MELDDLKSQWGDMTKDLKNAQPPVISSKGKKLSKPRAIQQLAEMNLAELIANFLSIPFLLYCWWFTDLLDGFSTGMNFLYLVSGIVILLPSMILFWQLQNPQPGLPSTTYLKRLIRLIDWFKYLQVGGNFLLTLVIMIPGFLYYTKASFKIDGIKYHRVIDLPDPDFQRIGLILLISAIVLSILGAIWGYLLYYMFYHFRKKELIGVMKQLEE